jgi:hypothetical protein
VPALSPRHLSVAAISVILAAGTPTLVTVSSAAGPAHAAKDDKDKGKDKDKGNDGWGDGDSQGGGSGDQGKKDKDKGDGAPVSPPAQAPASPVAPAPVAATVSTPATTSAPAITSVTAAPQLGVTIGLTGVTGTVLVRGVNGGPLQSLTAASALPAGAHVDARNGTVALTSAIDAQGTTQTGHFSGGLFAARQAKGGGGVTTVVMLGGRWGACHATNASERAVARAAKRRRKPIRSLWGSDDHGRFQTQGHGSVATVRGTKWLTEDFCDGTRTTVSEGAVAVRNRSTGRVTVVRAGHSFFAPR